MNGALARRNWMTADPDDTGQAIKGPLLAWKRTQERGSQHEQ